MSTVLKPLGMSLVQAVFTDLLNTIKTLNVKFVIVSCAK